MQIVTQEINKMGELVTVLDNGVRCYAIKCGTRMYYELYDVVTCKIVDLDDKRFVSTMRFIKG